jgi:hypothetical protein
MNARLAHLALAAALTGNCTQSVSLNKDSYALRDSAQWECGGNGGRFGLLYRGRAFVDSIDIATGFQLIPQGLILTPVRSEDDGQGGRIVCPQDPVLLDGITRRPLGEFLLYFDPHFPTRALLDSAVLYWGFIGTRAYAARFRLTSHTTDTTFLVEDSSLFETDNSFQFLPPLRVDSTYLYETATGLKFSLGLDFHVIPNSATP